MLNPDLHDQTQLSINCFSNCQQRERRNAITVDWVDESLSDTNHGSSSLDSCDNLSDSLLDSRDGRSQQIRFKISYKIIYLHL